MPPTASHGALTTATEPRTSRLALWIFVASAVVCTLVYLAITVQGSWFGSAKTLHWTTRDMSVTEASREVRPDGIAVRPSDAIHPARIAVSTSIRAIDYPVIAWETRGVPDDAEVAVLWQNEYEPGRVLIQISPRRRGGPRSTIIAGAEQKVGRPHQRHSIGRKRQFRRADGRSRRDRENDEPT
jgi:hypothetical protein